MSRKKGGERLFCDMKSVEEKQIVEVFMEGDDFWLKVITLEVVKVQVER